MFMLFCAAVPAEVLDRVAVSIGNQVITESQLIEEIKLDSFLNHEPPNFSHASKRAAADRLIEQKLIQKEMEMGRYPPASPTEAAAMIENLRKSRPGGPAAFDQELKEAGITLEELQEHLRWGLTLSHFIDLRFRPAGQVTRREVAKYYEDNIVAGANGQPKPSLDDVRPRIEEILTAQRSDALFDAWLKDTRAHTTIEYHKEVFNEENQK